MAHKLFVGSLAFSTSTERLRELFAQVGAVESALAMFSESTRIRPACARRPEVAMLIERAKSFPSLAMIAFP